MISNKLEPGLDPEFSADSLPILRACSIEIRVHQVIFFLLFLPFLGVIFPVEFTALSVYVVAHAISSLPGFPKSIADVYATYWSAFLTVCGVGLVASAAVIARQAMLRELATDRTPEGRKPPRGPKGMLLVQRVASIWARSSTRARPIPSVVWYSNFNVLAHAYDIAGTQTIEVSSGLWERVAGDDPVAAGILAHETAHLVFRDGPMFRALAVATVTLRQLLRLVTRIGVAATGIVILSQFANDIASHASAVPILKHACAIAAVGACVLVALPLSVMIVRRYSGFVVSLMEMRADVSAALWTSSRTSFAKALASDPTLRQSSLVDLGHSLIALDMTHISETERLHLLQSTDRLITPKTRYFALSLALPLLMPINALTYLIGGGAIDHALVTAVVVAFQFAATTMIMIGSRAVRLSWRRTWHIGFSLCLIQALPRIDLGAIGYLFTDYAIAIAVPGGFGTDPISLSDFRITVMDVSNKIANALGGPWFLLAVVVASVSLRVTSFFAGRSHSYWGTPVIAATVVSLLSSFDEWRDWLFLDARLMSVVEGLFSLTQNVTWLRLCAPSMAALTALLFGGAISRGVAVVAQRIADLDPSRRRP